MSAWSSFLVASVAAAGRAAADRARAPAQPAALRTGTAALVGRPAIVLERIANDDARDGAGSTGEVWTARAYDDDDVIEAGPRVQVIEIRGATALVTE